MTLQEFVRTSYIEKVKGIKYQLWEVKYSGLGGKNYRMICFVWKKSLVGLLIFQGSGSGGKLSKFFKKAITLAEDWKFRNP